MAVKQSPFELTGIRFRTIRANNRDETPTRTLEKMRTILVDALVEGGLPLRNREEVAHMLGDLQHFSRSRRDPGAPDSGFASRPMRFGTPRITLAEVYDGDRYIDTAGYVITENNTSGPPALSALKMMVPPGMALPKIGGKRYVHLREIGVLPEYQHRGVGAGLVYSGLTPYHPRQIVSTYIHPIEQPDMAASLEAIGMEEKLEDRAFVDFLRTGHEDVAQRHYLGAVSTIQSTIFELPGASTALVNAA